MWKPWFRCLLKLAAVILLVHAINASSAEAEGLLCEMSVERDTLLVAEPIWVDVTIHNSSDERVDSNCLSEFPEDGCFELIDEAGASLSYTGIYSSRVGYPYLDPGAELMMTYNLLKYFGQGTFDPPSHLPPGTYEVRFDCEGLCEAAADTFVVVEPVGMDKAAYELFALGRGRTGRAGKEDAALEAFEAVVSQHPHSGYGDISLHNAGSVLRIAHRNREAVIQSQRLLDLYPNSGFSRSALKVLLHYSPTQSEGVAILDSAISAHPGTRAEIAARQLRSAIQSGKTGLWKGSHLQWLERMSGEKQ